MLEVIDVPLSEYDSLLDEYVDKALALANAEVYKVRDPASDQAVDQRYNQINECRLIVGVQDGSVSGMLAYRLDPGTAEAEIEAFATAPGLQRVRGVGSLLLRCLESSLVCHEIAQITLHAKKGSEGFYEKKGFRHTGVDDIYIKQLD